MRCWPNVRFDRSTGRCQRPKQKPRHREAFRKGLTIDRVQACSKKLTEQALAATWYQSYLLSNLHVELLDMSTIWLWARWLSAGFYWFLQGFSKRVRVQVSQQTEEINRLAQTISAQEQLEERASMAVCARGT